jgi:hypothetical protein
MQGLKRREKKSIKLLEDIAGNLCNFGLGIPFLDMVCFSSIV